WHLITCGSRHQNMFAIVEALPDLRRGFRACILVLDVARDLARVVPNIPEHRADRSVAFSKRDVRALVLLAVLDMQTHDDRLVLAEVGCGIEAGGDEMSDVQRDPDIVGPAAAGCGEIVRRGYFFGPD